MLQERSLRISGKRNMKGRQSIRCRTAEDPGEKGGMKTEVHGKGAGRRQSVLSFFGVFAEVAFR
jgi:hypothetical protein